MCVTGIHHTCRSGLLRRGEDTRHQYTLISNTIGDGRKDVPDEEAFQRVEIQYNALLSVHYIVGGQLQAQAALTVGKIHWCPSCRVDRDSSVGIETRYGLGSPGIESRWGRDFTHLSRPALGPTQPPIQ
jgi:hypothetical protein